LNENGDRIVIVKVAKIIFINNNATISSGDAAPLSVNSIPSIRAHRIRLGFHLCIKPCSLVGLPGNE